MRYHRLTVALATRVRPPCEPFGPGLKVLTPGRVRYPDASVVCADPVNDGESIEPTVVFEVLSPSTALTDRRVKALECGSVPGIMAYVILEAEQPEIAVRGRATGWEAETIAGFGAELVLPGIGVAIPLSEVCLYAVTRCSPEPALTPDF